MESVADEPEGFAAWARAVLLGAAEKKMAKRKVTDTRQP